MLRQGVNAWSEADAVNPAFEWFTENRFAQLRPPPCALPDWDTARADLTSLRNDSGTVVPFEGIRHRCS